MTRRFLGMFSYVGVIGIILATPANADIDIFIDPGHGGQDPGPQTGIVMPGGVYYSEKHIDLEVAQLIECFLVDSTL